MASPNTPAPVKPLPVRYATDPVTKIEIKHADGHANRERRRASRWMLRRTGRPYTRAGQKCLVMSRDELLAGLRHHAAMERVTR